MNPLCSDTASIVFMAHYLFMKAQSLRDKSFGIKLANLNMFKIIWLFFALSWGSIRIFISLSDPEGKFWSFGQCVPALLLALPLLAAMEIWYGK